MVATAGPSGAGDNPFVVHRRHLDVHRRALVAGLQDGDFVRLVTETDERIASIDGTGFTTTPLVPLEPQYGPAQWPQRTVLAKVETANVSGSHKARHLFGALLGLVVDEWTSGRTGSPLDQELAIASCGNAALGAAVVAAAAQRRLRGRVPVTRVKTMFMWRALAKPQRAATVFSVTREVSVSSLRAAA